MEPKTKQENMLAGIAGALIGGIIGGAAIMLVGQLGLISAIGGVILAFCTLKGYELPGKKWSKRGILACILIMLIVPYLADRVSWALEIVKVSEELFGSRWLFGDAFLYVHAVVKEVGAEAEYWKDLLFIYAFTALGAYTAIKQTIKQANKKTY